MTQTLDLTARKTKIVCTIGPATESPAQLQALLEAGMNVARLNFSHGNHTEHGQRITHLRRLAEELGTPLAILQDLAGPKVRIGAFAQGPIELSTGDHFTLTTRAVPGSKQEVSVSYERLPQEVKPGDVLLLADGNLELEIKEVGGNDIHCWVVVGGMLSAHKGVNCPSGLLEVPILDEKDLQDLRFGVQQGVDYIGLSFIRTAEDVSTAKRALAACGSETPVIAKIETQAALTNLSEILHLADGIMIARGDLGIETPFARVPQIQKQLIRETNIQAKPIITATHMLVSMVDAPRPTRAEVADVANAVLDGSDAVMLSEETAVGQYPVRAVHTMAAIAQEAEKTAGRTAGQATVRMIDWDEVPVHTTAPEVDAMAEAACHIAATLKAAAIATVTVSGFTALSIAKYRPPQPIVAITPRLETYRRLALVRGVTPLLLTTETENREEMVQASKALLRRHGLAGRKVVIVSFISAEQHLLTTDVL
jgi:pyruvate kinase